jgi:hypothetical protein
MTAANNPTDRALAKFLSAVEEIHSQLGNAYALLRCGRNSLDESVDADECYVIDLGLKRLDKANDALDVALTAMPPVTQPEEVRNEEETQQSGGRTEDTEEREETQEALVGTLEKDSDKEANTDSPPVTVPLAQDKMRIDLEIIFKRLYVAHDEVSVCGDVANLEGAAEVAHVLNQSVCSRIFEQLESLTSIIEQLGGRTEYSEEEESGMETPNEEAEE